MMSSEPDPRLLAGTAAAADADAPQPERVSQAFARLRSLLFTGRRNRTFVKRLLTLLQPRARLRPLPLSPSSRAALRPLAGIPGGSRWPAPST
jgi:hypothetical protein